jgi:hypothetical protein
MVQRVRRPEKNREEGKIFSEKPPRENRFHRIASDSV